MEKRPLNPPGPFSRSDGLSEALFVKEQRHLNPQLPGLVNRK
jgi:hypothetical protein